jgi:hypothetical protein
MTEHYSKMHDKTIELLSTVAKMTEFTVAIYKWLSTVVVKNG